MVYPRMSLLWCHCHPGALLPARAGAALRSPAAQGILGYRNVFEGISSPALWFHISVSEGSTVFARQCLSGKKIVRNCINARLFEKERKTFVHKDSGYFSNPFLLVKLLLTCRASKL